MPDFISLGGFITAIVAAITALWAALGNTKRESITSLQKQMTYIIRRMDWQEQRISAMFRNQTRLFDYIYILQNLLRAKGIEFPPMVELEKMPEPPGDEDIGKK